MATPFKALALRPGDCDDGAVLHDDDDDDDSLVHDRNPSHQPKGLRRRRIQVFFSITSSAVGLVLGVVLLSTGVAEPLVAQIPLDPFISLGLLTMTFAGAGWLVGPSIGSQVFYLMNRSLKNQINHKEAEFFARIRKNRVDPSNSSTANPVPDFYGEKIQSVNGYRQWLKDQRAFNKKKSADLI
ncbi:mitochondrial import inner membrane translocase subunit TIM23 [Geosmithia morbida]|uniref:Presequence translocated-associated motor subunit PAM17 n=1 Tax=Geosmithia morbida TaxID=1094350 RepID=A0A9P5D460_9HYPO|nr:mitochondrial import inner membrane translocase subunit TIM23 [Geosmithia morbida]KAF4126978.1 mitochondrial import inner membrane translocase subunit TIM23 [Geosmithia morbida]